MGWRCVRWVAAVLLLSLSVSGCLADDIWREPFVWRDVAQAGENADAAQAFAGAFGDAPERIFGDVDEGVFATAEDLPDTVYFQNLKDFIEAQAPGRGEEVEETTRTALTTAGEGYRNLTGQVAQAWETGTGDFTTPSTALEFQVADRTTRLRMVLDVALAQAAPEAGANPSPLGNVELRLTDPRGALRAHYVVDTTRHIEDLFVVGTYGDANEVRDHLGGTWSLDVSATGEGGWSVVLDAYEPEYRDYSWWQVWRGDFREVA